ncbi:MICOS complex subunit Mic26-like [Brachionus plicatilis]|uniref:MICOS complex subunit n=1 Tax=Brachionus plicatilis TaxID=10195 RepID=A0A3M7S5M8_BRAPC|nr:MICOS complex subunit Mic26-like [Brachionus plicatilis]
MSSRTIKDLPIYGESSSESSKPVWAVVEKTEKSELEKFVTNFRQSVCSLMGQFQKQTNSSIQYYEQSRDSLKNKVDYVRSETNIIPKFAFISLSGLSGLLLGYRKSIFKKVLYSSLLTSGSAALCYPKETKNFYNKAYEASSIEAMDLYRTYIWPEEKKTSKKSEAVEKMVEKKIDPKDKVVKLDNQTIESSVPSKTVVGDRGQSREEDEDMYSSRK